MEKLRIHRSSSMEWKPAPVVALAASVDGSRVAAARDDGSVEMWLVSPGSVGWHCQLTVQGDPCSRVSSLAWYRPSFRSTGPGILLSSSIDGSISEWDLCSLSQKIVVDSIGVSIWQMAVEPSFDSPHLGKTNCEVIKNGHSKHGAEAEWESSLDDDNDDNEDDDDEELSASAQTNGQRLAVACDDGCIRMYNVSNKDGLTYIKSFPRVSGRILSITWSHDAKLIFAGSSNGFIRCWDVASFHEKYCITVGLGGLGSGSELCVWSLLFLRSGTLVSGDSTGSVQFWDSCHGTLIQAHTYHKGDVNALATLPTQNRVFSAGSDGQVILYKHSFDIITSDEEDRPEERIVKWIYVGYVRVHTHDVRALVMATPICREDQLPERKLKKRRTKNATSSSFHKWANIGVPMLISGGDDAKLFAYSAKEFTQFSPHDICPAPQRPLIKMANTTVAHGASMMLAQSPGYLDVFQVSLNDKRVITRLLARVNSKGSKKIICSAISSCGVFFAYSDQVKPSLFELKKHKVEKNKWMIEKIQLHKKLPYSHSMTFSADSSRLILAGHDRKIYIVDIKGSKPMQSFVPQKRLDDTNHLHNEAPVTKMFTSPDGKWLSAINCFGDINIFNLEKERQHWFISRLNGASVTAGGFLPKNSNNFVIATSCNEVFVFDLVAKELGEWSKQNNHYLPCRFQEFPGEIIGLTFLPFSSTSVIVYSARAMCLIDFGRPVDQGDECPISSDQAVEKSDFGKSNGSMRKRKLLDHEPTPHTKKNFDFFVFKHPALFVSNFSENSLLLIEKQWIEVIKNFDAPIHRHVYGT